jgi:hypothetical protein
MVSPVPESQRSLFKQARHKAELVLVKSVKQKIQDHVAKQKPEDEFEIEILTVEIANKVFNTEYDTALAETLNNKIDRDLLFALDQVRVLGRLIEEGKAFFRSQS